MLDMWNKRYADKAYAYGKEPNKFFKQSLIGHDITGKLLLPAEGEGRNAVFAALQGIDVTAFDISEEGKKKAMQLAQEQGTSITYEVGNLAELNIVNEAYDAAALIFAHFPPHLVHKYHRQIAELIKPGGLVILEGFSKNHLPLRKANPEVGGPANLDMLFSRESIKNDFYDFEPLLLKELTVKLKEGQYHNGICSVIRFVGRKNE